MSPCNPRSFRLGSLAKTACFCVFFAIGSTAMCLALLTGDLVRYYNRKHRLTYEQQMVDWLDRLNADYQMVLQGLQEDPNLLVRLAPAVIGLWPKEPNTAYPQARPEELMAARQAIITGEPAPAGPAQLPGWLDRCSRPLCRYLLLGAGAGLVLVSFVFVGRSGPQGQDKEGT
ncbi:MAG: hypothetical protein QHH07_05310 [Sedimentisphaerales bacterium]|jgi:hypothetical protein|nr:hypothetical protein [Sedimentisphaerales bacterium]